MSIHFFTEFTFYFIFKYLINKKHFRGKIHLSIEAVIKFKNNQIQKISDTNFYRKIPTI